MPELPEVETIVREIRPVLAGRRITDVQSGRASLRLPWSRKWNRSLTGRCIQDVRRRGKWIILELKSSCFVLFHLGMTGQLVVASRRTPKKVHTHLIFGLSKGQEELRFRDIRRFGGAIVFASNSLLEQFFMGKALGPEPFGMKTDDLQQKLRGTRRSLKAILLDQSFIAGIGNIYADESLFRARLHPAQTACRTSPIEVSRLCRAIKEVLTKAVRLRGSSIRDFVGGLGQKGGYQGEFQVYGQGDRPCPRCKAPIQRIWVAGRSTHFCARCQPLRAAENSHST